MNINLVKYLYNMLCGTLKNSHSERPKVKQIG